MDHIDRLFGVRDNMCVSGGVRDCFYVHTVVKREKREMILLPLLYEREGSGLEREVWPGQEVTRRGGAFCRSRREKRRKQRDQKDRCVELVALEVCSYFEASGKRDLRLRFSFGCFENCSRL